MASCLHLVRASVGWRAKCILSSVAGVLLLLWAISCRLCVARHVLLVFAWAVRWAGTEEGIAPYPCWSTTNGNNHGAGDPNGADWYPAETDFTLQNGDLWCVLLCLSLHCPHCARLRASQPPSHGILARTKPNELPCFQRTRSLFVVIE
jgi:hypothetical protein